MGRRARSLSAAGAIAVLLAACGGDAAQEGVATVGKTVIPEAELSERVAVTRRVLAAGGTKIPRPRLLERQLAQQLIEAEWIEQETAKRGIGVSAAEQRRAFEEQRRSERSAFPSPALQRQYLEATGATDLAERNPIRIGLLQRKLFAQVSSGSPTEAAIERHYARHRRRYAQLERRDVQLVQTRTKRRVLAARAALEGGESWKAVTKRFSIDTRGRQHRANLIAVTTDDLEPALGRAVFSARRGQLVGPVKTASGWYLVEVARIIPGRQPSLAEARGVIRDTLAGELRTRAVGRLWKRLRREYSAKTVCGAGLRLPDCQR